MSLSTGTKLGPYEIVAPLGAGGMGEVYRARDTRLDRDVALKVIHPQLAADADRLARFTQEAKAAARLDHPNILVVHDVGSHEGSPYIVSELLEGASLRELIGAPLPPKKAVEYALEIARGLSAAHGKGIVHRDLKPENVFVTKDGRIKILDFGVAKLTQPSLGGPLDTAATTAAATEPGVVLGTVGYMSPEQVQGKPLDARSDLFSLGAVLYEMLSGKRPFHRGTAPETLTAILREEPPDLTETNKNIAPGLERIVRHCLEKEPERRFHSAPDVVFDLEALRGISGEKPVASMSAAGVFLHRHRVAVAASALLIALALGAGWWWKTKGGPGAVGTRLAVLPFENLTGDPEQAYLADGIHESLITDLARLSGFSRVIARPSVMSYVKTTKRLAQIGKELGVDTLVTGSVMRAATKLKVTAHLINPATEEHLWSDSFEREPRDILSLQNEIVRSIAERAKLALTPAEQTRLAAAKPVNPEAYEAYLKGMQSSYRLTPQDLVAALEYFELALKKDPNYAPAYAGVSFVWLDRQQAGYTAPREAGPKAKAAALKAIELDSTLGEGHSALAAFNYLYAWDWAGAEVEFKRAIELNPNFPDVRSLYSHYLMIMKHPEEAMAEIQRALQLDPLNEIVHIHHATLLESAGRYDEAIVQLRNLLRTDPQNPFAHWGLSISFFRKAKYEESLAEMKAVYAADREMEEALTQGYAQLGYRGAMSRAADLLAARGRTTHVLPNDVASLYAIAGEKVQALEWLEKGFEARDPNMPYLNLYPEFETLRSEPRFISLLRKMNLPAS